MFISIKWRTYLVFILCFLIFIFATFGIVSRVLIQDLKERAVVNATQQVDTFVRLLDDQFKTMSTVFYNIFFDKEIIRELQKGPGEMDYYGILRRFELFMMANDYKIYSIYLYDERNGVVLTTEDYSSYPYEGGWTEAARANERPALEPTRGMSGARTRMISYTGWIRDKYFGDRLGMIAVNMLHASLDELFSETPAYPGEIQLLLDDTGSVAASRGEVTGELLAALAESGEPQYLRVGSERYVLLQSTVEPHGWRYIELLPEREVFRSVRQLLLVFSALFALFSVVMLAVSYAVFSSVTRPILSLTRMVEGYRSGRPCAVRLRARRPDEISYLYQSLQNMMQRTDHLIDEVYQADLYKKETQLRMYREGIDPHFIYNILDSIVWTLKFGEYEKATQVLQDFSAYLRGTLGSRRDKVTVAEMEGELRAYASLAAFLKNEPVTFACALPAAWRAWEVLSFLLQPIVENCFNYAFPKRSGTIRVEGRQEGSALCFTVEDDGIGMEPERLAWLNEHIQAHTPQARGGGFGLGSIHQRIRLCYGAAYGLSVTSCAGAGTCVRVRVPAPARSRAGHSG